MRKRTFLLALAGCWLYCQSPVTAGDLTSVDEIVAGYIKALGGRDKIDNVKSMRMSGKVNGGGMEFPMTIEVKSPDKVRIEFTFQGMTGIQAYDGTAGWFILPFTGKTDPEKMPAEMSKIIEEQADIHGPIVDAAKKGHKIELIGKEDFEGAACYKLKVTKKSGSVEYHYLDADQLLTVKVKGKREMMGNEIEFEMGMGDYKSVEGLMIAHSVEQTGGPQGTSTITFEKVEINPKFADDRFAMPAVKKPEAADENKDKEGAKEEKKEEKKDPAKP